MRKLIFKSLAVLALGATVTSCEEGDLAGNADLQTKAAELYLIAEGRTNQIFGVIDEGFKNADYQANGTVMLNDGDGPLFFNDAANNDMPTIDYGTGTTIGGELISGKVTLDQQGTDYLMNNAIVEATMVGLEVDGSPVLGKITVENISSGTVESREISVVNFIIEESAGDAGMNVFNLNTGTKLDWIAGSTTPNDVSDDEYEISGNTDGLPNIRGVLTPAGETDDVSIDIDITQKLVVSNACDYRIVSGISTLTFGTSSTDEADTPFLSSGTLDFDENSTGTCDQFARLEAVTKDGGSLGYTLTLQKVN
jgi:hypothetical protein